MARREVSLRPHREGGGYEEMGVCSASSFLAVDRAL